MFVPRNLRVENQPEDTVIATNKELFDSLGFVRPKAKPEQVASFNNRKIDQIAIGEAMASADIASGNQVEPIQDPDTKPDTEPTPDPAPQV